MTEATAEHRRDERIRWLAQQALSGFDTLDLEDAVEGAKADLRDILDACVPGRGVRLGEFEETLK